MEFSCEWNSIETKRKRKLNGKQFINGTKTIYIPMKCLINCCANRDIELNLVTKKRREKEWEKQEKRERENGKNKKERERERKNGRKDFFTQETEVWIFVFLSPRMLDQVK